MPTDTDDGTGILFFIALLVIATNIHIAYIFYHKTIWGGSLKNKIWTAGMALIYIFIFTTSLVVLGLPDTSDLGANAFFYLGILVPLFNIGMYGYTYINFKSHTMIQANSNSGNSGRGRKRVVRSRNENSESDNSEYGNSNNVD